MKQIILFSLFLLITYPLSANTIKFDGGMENEFDILDFYPSTYIPNQDSILSYGGLVYLGFSATMYAGFNQFTLSLLPGFTITNPLDNSDNYKVHFMFREAYFRFDGLDVSVIVGKRPLAWGEGFTKQYSFFVNESFATEDSRYYNIEVFKRMDATLISMGLAVDTKSIDVLEKPTWYTPWIYIQYDQELYTILSSITMTWHEGNTYDVKGALDFQYFLPKGFELYSSFAYYMLKESILGQEDELRFLAGLQHEYMHDNNIMLISFMEYAWEDYHNLFAMGMIASLYQVSLLLAFNYEKELNLEGSPSILTRLTWTMSTHFEMYFEYSHYFTQQGTISHSPRNTYLMSLSTRF